MKQKIKNAIQSFNSSEFYQSSINFFDALGYNSDKRSKLARPDFDHFIRHFNLDKENINKEKALVSHFRIFTSSPLQIFPPILHFQLCTPQSRSHVFYLRTLSSSHFRIFASSPLQIFPPILHFTFSIFNYVPHSPAVM